MIEYTLFFILSLIIRFLDNFISFLNLLFFIYFNHIILIAMWWNFLMLNILILYRLIIWIVTILVDLLELLYNFRIMNIILEFAELLLLQIWTCIKINAIFLIANILVLISLIFIYLFIFLVIIYLLFLLTFLL